MTYEASGPFSGALSNKVKFQTDKRISKLHPAFVPRTLRVPARGENRVTIYPRGTSRSYFIIPSEGRLGLISKRVTEFALRWKPHITLVGRVRD